MRPLTVTIACLFLVVFLITVADTTEQVSHNSKLNSRVDSSALNLKREVLSRKTAEKPLPRRHAKRNNRNGYYPYGHPYGHPYSGPQVGHNRQQVAAAAGWNGVNSNNAAYNAAYSSGGSLNARSNQPHRRRSRLLNIADNWEKIPYILQTYKLQNFLFFMQEIFICFNCDFIYAKKASPKRRIII
jgi:hypothetical protein